MTSTENESLDGRIRGTVITVPAGCVLIAFCLLFIAVLLAGFFDPVDPPFFQIFLSPLAFVLGVVAFKQYRALFCCKPEAARAFHEFYLSIGALAVFAGVVNFGEVFTESKSIDTDILFFLGGMLLTGLILLGIGIVLLLDTKRRKNHATENCPFGNHKQYIPEPFGSEESMRRDFFGILILIGITVLFSSFFVWDIRKHPISGEHLSYEQFPYKHFPSTGSDFSFQRLYRGTIYCEFTVSEQVFRDWIESDNRWEYCEPIREATSVTRILNGLDPENHQDVHITEGLQAGYGKHRGGRAVFDRKNNRAYYWTYY